MEFKAEAKGSMVRAAVIVTGTEHGREPDGVDESYWLFECEPDDAQRLCNALQLAVNDARDHARARARGGSM